MLRRSLPRLASLAIALSIAHAPRAFAQAPFQGPAAGNNADDALLHGFDLDLTLNHSSGLYTGAEGWLNQTSLYITPSYALGRHFRDTWAEGLVASARVLMNAEISGNDASVRGRHYATTSLLGSAGTARADGVPARGIDGLEREIVFFDTWFDVAHPEAWKIPVIDTTVSLGLRVVLPTSKSSRTSGMLFAPSFLVGLSRSFGPFSIDAAERVVGYVNARTSGGIDRIEEPVEVNGQLVMPWQADSNGSRNPTWGLVHALNAGFDVGHGVSLSTSWWMYSDFVYLPESCPLEGVAGADPCRDGALLGEVRNPAQRDFQYFQLSASWQHSDWGNVGFGLSTFQPTRMPDGSIANPFLRITRDNWSSLWLSYSVTAEALTKAFRSGAGR